MLQSQNGSMRLNTPRLTRHESRSNQPCRNSCERPAWNERLDTQSKSSLCNRTIRMHPCSPVNTHVTLTERQTHTWVEDHYNVWVRGGGIFSFMTRRSAADEKLLGRSAHGTQSLWIAMYVHSLPRGPRERTHGRQKLRSPEKIPMDLTKGPRVVV